MRAAVLFVFSVLTPLCYASSSQAMTRSMFEMTETFFPNISRFEKWNSMVERNQNQMRLPSDECRNTPFHPCHTVTWQDLLKFWKGKPFDARIAAVNTYANTFPYIVDTMNWGVEDFWATPYEFIAKNGDCEDYAIAKYMSLRATGIPASRLRIMIVQDTNLGGITHAVLGVYDDTQTLYLLDNQITQVVRADSVYHYKPIYSINEQGWWSYTPSTIGG
jgi:predicted transglutaminase-like cysteine proteinase